MAYGYIYGLYHPLTGELRYIGQTRRSLGRRLTHHLWTARRVQRPRHVLSWLKGLLSQGLRPEIRLLREAADEDELNLLEIQCISEARATGAALTNHDSGGRGSPGRPMSASHKSRLHNPDVWARIARTRKGQPSSRKGATLTLETREKIRRSKLGRHYNRSNVPTSEVLARHLEGMSCAQIGALLGVSRGTVRKRLKAAGIVLTRDYRSVTVETRRTMSLSQIAIRGVTTEEILRLKAEGVPMSDICTRTGLKKGAIYARVRKGA